MGKIIYNKSGAPFSGTFVFKLTSKVTNTGTETVTVGSDYTLSKQTKGGGFAEEQVDYVISGSVPLGKAVTVATLKVEALSNYYFDKSPYLETKFRNNIKLLLTKIEKDTSRTTKNITTYTFSIIYQNKNSVTRPDELSAELKYNSKAANVKSATIHHISFGSTTIPLGGANRPIKVVGTPGATFGIAINENFIDATGPIHKHNDTSILSTGNANSTAIYNYGKTINILEKTIDSTGVFKFNQKFPSIVLHKRVNGAVSGSANVVLEDVDDLKVGDAFFIADKDYLGWDNSGNINRYAIDSITTATKTVALTRIVTIADNARVSFSRQKSYSIDIIPDLTSTLGSRVSTSDPTYRLNQYLRPIIRFTAFTAGSTFTIRKLNDVATSLSAGAEHYYYLTGEANKIVLTQFDLKYELHAAGSDAFTAIRHPIFSSFVANDGTGTPSAAQSNKGSDWTNSVFSTNGGTDIVSPGATYTLSQETVANDTCVLHFKGYIRRFGTENVDLRLDLDKILTVS